MSEHALKHSVVNFLDNKFLGPEEVVRALY